MALHLRPEYQISLQFSVSLVNLVVNSLDKDHWSIKIQLYTLRANFPKVTSFTCLLNLMAYYIPPARRTRGIFTHFRKLVISFFTVHLRLICEGLEEARLERQKGDATEEKPGQHDGGLYGKIGRAHV